jgi:prefoldin subunit 5
MEKDDINILIFGHTTFGMRPLKVKKESVRIAACLLIFLQISITFFFCDYIQVRKKTFLLNQLRQESQIQKSNIQLFSRKVGELENKLSRLKDIDHRIRVIANLERGRETLPFIGMGGASSVTRAKAVTQVKSIEGPKESQKKSTDKPNETEEKLNEGNSIEEPNESE